LPRRVHRIADQPAGEDAMSLLFDPTSRLLGEMIQGTALRHRVLAANLANAETPEFQAQDVSFSAVLDDAARAGAGANPAVVGVRSTVTADADAPVRRDGSTVDLDRQMVKLAQNTEWHNAMLQILAGRFAMMKTAIRDRG
jgi:flagellar basal-body rod protein FlgB